MVDSGTPLIPIFPAPPRPPGAGWTEDYGNQLNRWLTSLTANLSGFTYLRANGMLVATTFPRSAYGLRVGEGFVDEEGYLRFVLDGDVGLSGVEATGSVGDLTVTV